MSRLDQMLAFLEQDQNDSFSRYAVALEYMSVKDHRKAREYLTELRHRDPDYVATYYQLGHVYSELEEWDAAEETYNAGIAVGKKAGDLHAVSELQQALDELDTLR
jgi:Tfp pilus assembly protein PilF